MHKLENITDNPANPNGNSQRKNKTLKQKKKNQKI